MGSFGIDDLGRVQFDQLCVALLVAGSGLPPGAFEPGMPGERVVRATAGARPPHGARTLPGPTVVLPLWVPDAHALSAHERRTAIWSAIRRELVVRPTPCSALVLTNARASAREVKRYVDCEVALLGPDELGAAVAATREACFELPWLAGLREADGVLDLEAVARSSGDVSAALELASVFVPTATYGHALATVRAHGFCVLTGPPEMGKTAIARMLGLAALSAGYELHECLRPDDLFARLDPRRAQVFVADDAFGSTEYRPDAAERWAIDLERALRAVDERHWLIWTARPGPLRAALARINREHGVERFPHPARVQVDASALAVDEKALILFRHARAADLPESARDAIRATGAGIVAHPALTPERIRRLVHGRLPRLLGHLDSSTRTLAQAVDNAIREPTAAMAASLAALEPAQRALLLALVDAPDGAVPERVLAAGARRHGDGGMPRPVGELVDQLADHFVRRVGEHAACFVHPSLRDLVIDLVAADADARRHFLVAASLDGVLVALSTAGGPDGLRAQPLLVDDADFDLAADRIAQLASELADDDAARLLRALTTAFAAPRSGRTGGELQALAELALERLRRRVDATPDTDLDLLDAWLELHALVPGATMPDVAALWVELLPRPGADLDDPDEARRADDWTRLVASLWRYARPTLADLGDETLGRGGAVVLRAAREQAQRAEPPPTAALLAAAVARLADATGSRMLEARAAALVEPGDDAARTPHTPRHARHWADLPDLLLVRLVLEDL